MTAGSVHTWYEQGKLPEVQDAHPCESQIDEDIGNGKCSQIQFSYIHGLHLPNLYETIPKACPCPDNMAYLFG